MLLKLKICFLIEKEGREKEREIEKEMRKVLEMFLKG